MGAIRCVTNTGPCRCLRLCVRADGLVQWSLCLVMGNCIHSCAFHHAARCDHFAATDFNPPSTKGFTYEGNKTADVSAHPYEHGTVRGARVTGGGSDHTSCPDRTCSPSRQTLAVRAGL